VAGAREVRVVRPEEMRLPAQTTPGMDRREAFDHDGVWAGTLRTADGVVTGWHVHPGHDTYIYVIAGTATIESGPGGHIRIDASTGDFILIPRGLIHREGSAAGSTGVEAVLVRVGEGEIVTNVDGPEPG
jgi:uncharacterized RmlC-like cupin family protein